MTVRDFFRLEVRPEFLRLWIRLAVFWLFFAYFPAFGRNVEERAHDRNATIAAIRTALKTRSGKAWSVKGGRGTAWGWIDISAPPARQTAGYFLPAGVPDLPQNYARDENKHPQGGGVMTTADREELGRLLGLGRAAYDQGENVPASSDYRQEYIDRAEGRPPRVTGSPYWD